MILNKININDVTTINTGIVYDVTEKHNGAEYETLELALVAIPIQDRNSGMTIKFRNASNHWYEQYRYLMKYIDSPEENARFERIANWIGVTDVISKNNLNLLQSRAIYPLLQQVLKNEERINNGSVYIKEPLWLDGYYDNNLDFVSYTVQTIHSGIIDISKFVGETLYLNCYAESAVYCGIKDIDGNIISTWQQDGLKQIKVLDSYHTLYVGNILHHNIEYYLLYKPNEFDKFINNAIFSNNSFVNNILLDSKSGSYYTSLLEVSNQAPMYVAKLYDVSSTSTVILKCRAASAAYCGFLSFNDTIVGEPWHQSGEETIEVPKGASKLCVSHDTNASFNFNIECLSLGILKYLNIINDSFNNTEQLIEELEKEVIKGGKNKITPDEVDQGYYDSNLQYVENTSGTLFAYKISIIDYALDFVEISAYAQSAAFCGFIDSFDEVIEKWHQNGTVTKKVPPATSYLLISHGTGRGVDFSLNDYIPEGGLKKRVSDLENKDITNESYINIQEYNSSKIYNITDYCKNNNLIQRCIVPVLTQSAFSQDNWEPTDIANDLQMSYPMFPKIKLNGLKWKAVGDSITADANLWSYVPVAAKLLGIGDNDYSNYGVGGAKFKSRGTEASNPPGDANIVTLFAGTNDFGSSSGATTIDNFRQDIIDTFERWNRGNYNARLYIISPFMRYDKLTNELGLTLKEYVDILSEVCTQYNVPLLNLYDLIKLNPYNETKYLVDHLHPTTYGKYRIAMLIANFISDCELMYRMIKFNTQLS